MYDVIILGATFAAAGIARSCCGSALILESRPDAGSEICALVNDVLYFRCKDHGNMRIHTLDWTEGERLYRGDSVGYDTVSAEKVVLLLKQNI